MIYSTDKCPLCNGNLELHVDKNYPDDKEVNLRYQCSVLHKIRDVGNTANLDAPHYINYTYPDNFDIAVMLIDEFYLAHMARNKRTLVYENKLNMPCLFIYEIPLLDMDYTRPHAVASRLKRLVPFS